MKKLVLILTLWSVSANALATGNGNGVTSLMKELPKSWQAMATLSIFMGGVWFTPISQLISKPQVQQQQQMEDLIKTSQQTANNTKLILETAQQNANNTKLILETAQQTASEITEIKNGIL